MFTTNTGMPRNAISSNTAPLSCLVKRMSYEPVLYLRGRQHKPKRSASRRWPGYERTALSIDSMDSREVLNSNVIIPCSSLALHQLGLTLSCKTKKFQQCSTMNDRRFNCSICGACGFAFDNFFPIEKHSKGWWIIPSHGVPECSGQSQ